MKYIICCTYLHESIFFYPFFYILNKIFRTSPAEPVKFLFDETLVEDSAGKLLPNQLTVDNLTVEWLRNKLSDLESGIKEGQEKRALLTPNNEGVVNGKVSSNNDTNNR